MQSGFFLASHLWSVRSRREYMPHVTSPGCVQMCFGVAGGSGKSSSVIYAVGMFTRLSCVILSSCALIAAGS